MRTLPTRLATAAVVLLAAASIHPSADGGQTPARVPATPAPAATATPSPSAAPPAAERGRLFVALYERGSAWNRSKGVFEQEGIEGHMQHLRANAVSLLGAGRFAQATDPATADPMVGLVIATAASQAEAEALFAADPAVASKVMKVVVRPWEARRLRAY
jgi:uncharacterized protein YciI